MKLKAILAYLTCILVIAALGRKLNENITFRLKVQALFAGERPSHQPDLVLLVVTEAVGTETCGMDGEEGAEYLLFPFNSVEVLQDSPAQQALLVWMIRVTIARHFQAELITLVFVYHVYEQGA